MKQNGQRKNERSAGPGRGKKGVIEEYTFPPKTLADLDISRNHSAKWQRVASIPEAKFEAVIGF